MGELSVASVYAGCLGLLLGLCLVRWSFARSFSVPQFSSRSFLWVPLVFFQVLCFCTLVFPFGASLSSAGQAVGSPLACRASSVTLLAAGVLISAGTVLWPGLFVLHCFQAMVSLVVGQCNFAKDVPLDGLFIGFRL